MIILFYSFLPVNQSLRCGLLNFEHMIFPRLSDGKNLLKVDRNIDDCKLQSMLFAAKIQKDTFLQVSELQPQQKKDLCFTNFSLDEFESMAAIYLTTKHAKNVLIVSLEKPHLSAYHTSITLSHRELAHCKIQSRNGDVFVIGKWIDSQQRSSGKAQNQRGSIEEIQKQQHKQERKQKRVKPDQKSQQKRPQLQPPARIQPVRQSLRVRTPSTSQAPSVPINKKTASSSKGKSLLDMMNNLDEDDDDEESSYSEKDDSDDSSSDESSSQQEDHQTGKKYSIAEKIKRKNKPVIIKTLNQDRQVSRQSKRNNKKNRKSDSSQESQEKSKEQDKIANKQEPINDPSKKNQNEQQKPFNYVIPTRLPDFLSKK